MKTASAALINLLNTTNNYKVADLITITLTNGSVLHYTSCDKPLTINGTTYKQLNYKRSSVEQEKGLSVSTCEIDIYASPSDMISGVQMTECFCNGTFDGAYLQLDLAFFTDWNESPEVLEAWVFGRMDVNEVYPTLIKVTVKSVVELLNVKAPCNMYQAECPWVLFSTECGASKASFTSNGTVTSLNNATTITCGLTQSNGYFDQGVIMFTSGKNYNLVRTVKTYTVGSVTVIHAFPYVPQVGDTFTITRGCQKTLSDCTGKFNNAANFGGQPYIPITELVV